MSKVTLNKMTIDCLIGDATLDAGDERTTLSFQALDAKSHSLQVTLSAAAMFQLAEVLVKVGHDFPEALATVTSKRS